MSKAFWYVFGVFLIAWPVTTILIRVFLVDLEKTDNADKDSAIKGLVTISGIISLGIAMCILGLNI